MEGDLILAFVADEEYESIGPWELVKRYKADAAIVPDRPAAGLKNSSREGYRRYFT